MKQLHWDQFCVMTTHYQQHTLEYALDSIAANGFRNVELWGASPHYCYDDYTPSGRNARVQEICRMLKSRWLKMPVFTPEQLRQYTINIASADAYVQKWSESIMMRYLEDTVSFGAQYMSLLPGWEFLDAKSDANYQRAVESMGRLAARAAQLGVTMVMEEVAPCESSFVTCLPELQRILRDVNSPALTACIDLPTAAANGEQVDDFYAQCSAVGHVHLADGSQDGYLALGTGQNDVTGQLEALATHEYAGTVSLYLNDASFFADPDTPTRQSAIWLRKSSLVRGI